MTEEGGIQDKGLEMLKKKAEKKKEEAEASSKESEAVEEKSEKKEIPDNSEENTKEDSPKDTNKDKKIEANADGISSASDSQDDVPARILIVEDSPPLRRMLEKILTSDGFAVDTAENGQIAVNLLTKNKGAYSMMMLDIMMPVLDGIKTMATIKKNEIEDVPPVVICSCRSDKETVMLANKLGAKGYILKPFKTDTVINKVREIVLSSESQ